MKPLLFNVFNLKTPINRIKHNYNTTAHYLLAKTVLFITYQNPELTIDSYETLTYNNWPNYIFIVSYTKSNVNHPYLTYADITKQWITILTPVGNSKGQVSFSDIYKIIGNGNSNGDSDSDLNGKPLTKLEYMAMYILILKTINVRQRGVLISDRYNILKCNAITHCKEKIAQLKTEFSTDPNRLQALTAKYTDYYYAKGIKLLTKFFDALKDGEFADAYDFLKGNGAKNKYFGRERLNTFFKDTRDVIGHLQIFIPLYEILLKLEARF